MVVFVQMTPTCPHRSPALIELKIMYTLGEVKVKPFEFTMVVTAPERGVVAVAWSDQYKSSIVPTSK